MPIERKEWVDRVFGQAVPLDPQSLIRQEEICGPNQATVVRLTEVFEDGGSLLKPYPDEALKQAFWDLGTNAFPALKREDIEWTLRQRMIRSFETLFREFFAARCQPTLGHLSEEGSPLNSPCYMWWDFDCWVAVPEPLNRNPMDSAFLASMRSILKIGHVACQESALHGLGHWHWAHGAAVEGIIDEFLKREPYLSDSLREYAHCARRGCVQ